MPVHHLILSPHLDDAVLSLGGVLSSRILKNIQIVTIFSQSRYTADGLGTLEDISAIRQAEDKAALDSLKIQSHHLDFCDTSARNDYAHEDDYMNPANDPQKDPLWSPVQDAVFNHIQSYDDPMMIWCPLGSAHHIEHRMIAQIGHDLLKQGYDVIFYEDAGYETSLNQSHIHHCATEKSLCAPLIFPNQNWHTKYDLMHYYASQMDDELIAHTRHLFLKLGGERVWSQSHIIEKLNNNSLQHGY